MSATVLVANTLIVAGFCATLALTVRGDDFRWPALASIATTVPSTIAITRSRATRDIDWLKFNAFLMTPVLGLGAYLLSTLDVFVVAWAATPWLFVPLYILNEADLVLYPVSSGTFMVQRMAFYASVRAYSVGLQRILGVPPLFPRMTVLAFGTAETLFMAIGGVRGNPLSYNFPIKSMEFATYALVKSVWLLCLPLLEEVVLEAM